LKKLQEREAELEEEMAYLNQQLEEEQQAREELENELKALRGGSASPQEVRALRLELEDMREAKERAEAMLTRAMPG
jgi:chromosome segregation ATPase